MSRTNSKFKDAYNQALTYIEYQAVGDDLPGEKQLADILNISRTTVRTVLSRLHETDIILWQGRLKKICRMPLPNDKFDDVETTSVASKIQQYFLEWILVGDVLPGTQIRETDLARQFEVSTSTVREFLIDFSRFGLITKSASQKWILQGFTKDYALELCDVRVLFEMKSLTHFVNLSEQDPVWQALNQLELEHLCLLKRIDQDYHEFSVLDEKLHMLINGMSQNRFMNDFQDLISLIFHYHYQWNKKDEKERNKQAIIEHLTYIDALKSRDITKIQLAAEAHLTSARDTLINSISGKS